MLWGRTLKARASVFSNRSSFICTANGKGGVMLASAGNDYSGDITEGKEVSNWIWIGSLVSEIMDFVEYVFVGTMT
jgi:hypothetical protein